jgi:hypothetical protein
MHDMITTQGLATRWGICRRAARYRVKSAGVVPVATGGDNANAQHWYSIDDIVALEKDKGWCVKTD